MQRPTPKKNLPLGEVYRHLEPGPVVLLSTGDGKIENVMTMSWHTMLEFEPPLIGCVVSDRDYSFSLLRKFKECAINIPTVKLMNAVVECGNTSGKTVNKFEKFKLKKAPASVVKAPLVADCYANFECKVVDSRLVNKYCFFVLEVVQAWIAPREKAPKTLHHRGRGIFMVAGGIRRTRSKMK